MKKSVIVEFSLLTRVLIEEEDISIETLSSMAKAKILDKIHNNELSDNLVDYYEDEENTNIED